MNFGPTRIEISIAMTPAMRTRTQALTAARSASATTSSPTAREALTRTQSPGSTSVGAPRRLRSTASGTQRVTGTPRGGLEVAARELADGERARRRRAAAMLAADLLVVARARRARARPCRRGPRRGAASPARVGEVVERRAHRDRVRVVGVVDQQPAARERQLLAAPARELDVDALRAAAGRARRARRARRRVLGLVARREVEARRRPDDRAAVVAARRRPARRRPNDARCRRARPGSSSGTIADAARAAARRRARSSPGRRPRASRRARGGPGRRS